MIHDLKFTPQAVEDIAQLKKSEPNVYKKINALLMELTEHPRIGTGRVKLLKYNGDGTCYSRRISGKHRLVYSINDETVTVLIVSAKGHYDDK